MNVPGGLGRLGVGLGVLLALGPANAQDPPPRAPDLLLPVSTELVRIDVIVTDRAGRSREGLGQKDFVILEDGQPQEIAQFEAIVAVPRKEPSRSPVAAAAPAAEAEDDEDAPARPRPPRRYVVLLVDDVHMEQGNLLRTKKALDRFLDREVGPEDLIALMTTSGTKGVFQEFTDDRHAIRRSVGKLSVQDRAVDPIGMPYMTEYQAQQIARGDPEALRVAVEEVMTIGTFQDEESAERQARAVARLVFAESVYSARLTLETLDNLVRSLSELQGRKVVALVSDGFLAGLTVGSSNAFDIRRIADASTRAGVVLYALDTKGLVAASPARSAASRMPMLPNTFSARDVLLRESEHATRDAMAALAADSGGFLVQGTNDLGSGLRRILKDTETYYAVAYEPKNTRRDGSFRRIEVKLPGARDLRVRARRGYYAPDDRKLKRRAAPPPAADATVAEAAPALAAEPTAAPPAEEPARASAEQRQAEMRMALTGPAPLRAIPVQLSADFVAVDASGPQVVVSSHMDLSGVRFARSGDRHLASVDTAATLFDESGSVVGSLAPERLALALTDATYEIVRREGVQYQKAAPVKPGRYRVRFAVREDGGKLGAASQWIQVPDLADGKLALSSLFLLKKDEASAPDPPDGGLALRAAQASRRYTRDEDLFVQLYAYNPKRDAAGATDLVSQTEIWRTGALLASSAPEPMAPGERGAAPAPHTRSVKLQPFDVGEYEVRVVVTDRNSREMLSRRATFSIE